MPQPMAISLCEDVNGGAGRMALHFATGCIDLASGGREPVHMFPVARLLVRCIIAPDTQPAPGLGFFFFALFISDGASAPDSGVGGVDPRPGDPPTPLVGRPPPLSIPLRPSFTFPSPFFPSLSAHH
ncbi:unnamed protein product [Prunus armeniaca]|uniref:Uncharacterized protein n=1 Tax=Prunus armeniaca TaxID=36596 RepID=A0A6J5TNN6_PRUAR|nr:unnamed protein product [Prunus armeniaca]